jgi:Myosin heavy chain
MKVLTFLQKVLYRKMEGIRYLEMSSATRIQTAWRKQRARRRNQARTKAAVVIQSFERMRVQRNQYVNFDYERLRQYHASRNLASLIQCLWRGHKGRSRARRQREKRCLPDPRNILNFDFWVSLQKASHPPNRVWGVYHEYILSGTPRTWYERNHNKRDGKYYRDVKFYAHGITRRASWDQPNDWHDFDRRESHQRISRQRHDFQ